MDHRWISGGVEISQRRHRPGSVLKNAEIDALVAIQGLQVVLHIAAAIAWGGDRNHRPAGFHPGHEGGTAIGTAIGSVAGEGDGGGRTGGAEHDGVGIAVERGWSQLVGAHTSLGRLAASAGCRAAVEIHDARHRRAAAAAGAHVSHPVLHRLPTHRRSQVEPITHPSGEVHAGPQLALLGAELPIGHQIVETERLGVDRVHRIFRSGRQAGQHRLRQGQAERVAAGAVHRHEQQRLIEQHLLDHAPTEQHGGGDGGIGIQQAHRCPSGQHLNGNAAVDIGAVVVARRWGGNGGGRRVVERIAHRGRLSRWAHRHLHHPFDRLELQWRVAEAGVHRDQRQAGVGIGIATG